jgi:hypothetical protein
VIIVKAAPGLVIEFGVGPSGKWDNLSVRLSEGLSSSPFSFEAAEGADGRLLVRALETRTPSQLVVALGAVLAHEDHILAEVRKYNRPRE